MRGRNPMRGTILGSESTKPWRQTMGLTLGVFFVFGGQAARR